MPIQSFWIDGDWTAINSKEKIMKRRSSPHEIWYVNENFICELSHHSVIWNRFKQSDEKHSRETTHGICFFKVISASENELSKPSILRFLASSSSSLSVVLHCTGRNWTLCDRMIEASAGDRACFLRGGGYSPRRQQK